MNKALKWGLIICVGLVVLVIATLLIAPAFIDIQDYKPEIEKLVTEKTGRAFSVGDDMSLSLFPWAGVLKSLFAALLSCLSILFFRILSRMP